MSGNRNKSLTTGLFIALIALLGIAAYLWYQNSQLNAAQEQQQQEYVELEKIQKELEQDYQTSLENLEEMRGDNQELNEMIDTQKEELRIQKNKINNLIWTSRELDKAKSEMEGLRNQAASYVSQIQELRDKNQQLSSSNLKLRNENDVLENEVTTGRKTITKLDSTRTVLFAAKEELEDQNSQLGSQVDMASAIKINSIEVQGYKKRGEKLVKKSKGGTIDVLRTCIKTETNLVTSKGSKTFYVRLINPAGQTITDTDVSSGIITNKLDGTEVRYSMSGELDYAQKESNACFDWPANRTMSKGNYLVEVFNNGYMVGQGSFQLK